jgi:FkbM family methyltransferase
MRVVGLKDEVWRVRRHFRDAATTRRARHLYGHWVSPASLCFDVGANVGERAKVLLSLGATVIAVEPQPDCQEVLRALAADRLIVEPVALGDCEGRAEMHVSTASVNSTLAEGWIERVRSTGRFGAHDWRQKLTVPVVTLDSLIERHGRPDFCKIDVEGYEAEVVAGLSQPLPMLSFEFTPEWDDATRAVLARLGSLGFDGFDVSIGESFMLEWHEWRDAKAVLEWLARLQDRSVFGDVYARVSALI